MARKCRFVKPEIVRLELSDGDWLEVKKRLSIGEERASFQQISGSINNEGWIRPNVEMVGIAEVLAYLVDWSLIDANDKPVKVSKDALLSMDPDDYKEIEEAVQAHIKKMDAERAHEKKVAGLSASSTSAPSVVS